MSDATYSIFDLGDGARIAYEILGVQHLGSRQPLVLVGGMSSRRIDWERLATSLAEVRPSGRLKLYGTLRPEGLWHRVSSKFKITRGMGDSKLTSRKDEKITIESLARDLVSLLDHLQWKNLSLCGFSMGGVVSQQLLFLPHHPAKPVVLPFRVTHVILAGTLCSVLKDRRYGLRVSKDAPSRHLSVEEKREIARPTLESTFDQTWLENPANSGRFNWWLERMISGGRPTGVILQQGRAVSQNVTSFMNYDDIKEFPKLQLNRIEFDGYHDKLSRSIEFLVIHGELDGVVPFYCGQEILQCIPWAKMVKVGNSPGQVESYAFGHHWFEYFEIRVWHDVVEDFLSNPSTAYAPARL